VLLQRLTQVPCQVVVLLLLPLLHCVLRLLLLLPCKNLQLALLLLLLLLRLLCTMLPSCTSSNPPLAKPHADSTLLNIAAESAQQALPSDPCCCCCCSWLAAATAGIQSA
jgi:hypothetical protein